MSVLSNRIKEAMVQQDMTQQELARKCALPKSTVSMYLSGKAVPSKNRLEEIAGALGLTTSELLQVASENTPTQRIVRLRIGVRPAAECLGKRDQFVRDGLKSGVLPFGSAVQKPDGRWTYYINPVKFREYVTPEIFDRYFKMA